MPAKRKQHDLLKMYDLLRKAHHLVGMAGTFVDSNWKRSALVVNALDSVSGVLYMAEGEIVRAHQVEQEGK